MEAKKLELIVDGMPYEINIRPFTYNDELRFYVSYNNSQENVFARDASIGRYTAIDSDAADIPDNLEEAIAERLNAYVMAET